MLASKVNISDHTKVTQKCIGNVKSFLSISDVNKLYRRQQNYKKKLKTLIQTNSILQTRIKIYQSSIKDERSTIVFQLNQLSKTMNNKISTYVDEKLDKDRFKNNQKAHETIKQMITKFEGVQKQTKVSKRVYTNLNAIYQKYQAYSQQIDKLVKMTQKSNKQYEDGMKNMLQQKKNQIISKKQNNEDIYDNTQAAIKKIDEYQIGKLKLIEQQKQLLKYYQKLLKIQEQQKKQVDRFKQWSQIVIDKNHRKLFTKENKTKDAQLRKITETNDNLQVYLKDLENEQYKLQLLLQEKQNQTIMLNKNKTTSKIKKNNKETKCVLNNDSISKF